MVRLGLSLGGGWRATRCLSRTLPLPQARLNGHSTAVLQQTKLEDSASRSRKSRSDGHPKGFVHDVSRSLRAFLAILIPRSRKEQRGVAWREEEERVVASCLCSSPSSLQQRCHPAASALPPLNPSPPSPPNRAPPNAPSSPSLLLPPPPSPSPDPPLFPPQLSSPPHFPPLQNAHTTPVLFAALPSPVLGTLPRPSPAPKSVESPRILRPCSRGLQRRKQGRRCTSLARG